MEERPATGGNDPAPRWYAAAIPILLTVLAIVVVAAALTA